MTTEQITIPTLSVLTTTPFTGLGLQMHTTLTNMKQSVGDTPERLLAEVQRLGLTMAGPIIFHYDGISGDQTKAFDLLIVAPVVAEGAEPSGFSYQAIAPFHCATYTYTGPWENLDLVYDALFPAFYAQGFSYNGQVREVYRVVDFEQPNNHVTEIQVGVS